MLLKLFLHLFPNSCPDKSPPLSEQPSPQLNATCVYGQVAHTGEQAFSIGTDEGGSGAISMGTPHEVVAASR